MEKLHREELGKAATCPYVDCKVEIDDSKITVKTYMGLLQTPSIQMKVFSGNNKVTPSEYIIRNKY